MDGLQQDGIPRCELLFEKKRKLPLFDVVVGTLAGIRSVLGLQVIGKIPEGSILRAGLCPGAPAQIFRARNNPETVALE